MKKIILGIIAIIFVSFSFAQEATVETSKAHFPAVEIKTLNGTPFNTKDIQNDGKPVIISLWATWCKSCVLELMAIDDLYEDWIEETGVKLYAISIDDSKTSSKVAPFVSGKGWNYEILLDVNSDLKRALNIIDIPFLCILNGMLRVLKMRSMKLLKNYPPNNLFDYEFFFN